MILLLSGLRPSLLLLSILATQSGSPVVMQCWVEFMGSLKCTKSSYAIKGVAKATVEIAIETWKAILSRDNHVNPVANATFWQVALVWLAHDVAFLAAVNQSSIIWLILLLYTFCSSHSYKCLLSFRGLPFDSNVANSSIATKSSL